MRINSIGGSKYFLTFIDDKSRWCEIYFLKKKSEVFEKFKEYKSMVETRTNKKIKAIRSDNGTEYTSNEFTSYLKKEGIKHEFTVVCIHLNKTVLPKGKTELWLKWPDV